MAGPADCRSLCQRGRDPKKLIRAAADYAEGNGPTPPELQLYWQCRDLNALPYAGGVLDQPAGLVQRMRAANNVYQAQKAFMSMRLPDFHRRYPDGMKLVQQVYKLRAEMG